MGEGYGCSNFQCSTLANAIKFIHSCGRAAVVHQIRKPFVHQIKDDTPIFNRQVTKEDYCTQQLGHHACFTCEVNGFVRAVHMLHAHLPIAF